MNILHIALDKRPVAFLTGIISLMVVMVWCLVWWTVGDSRDKALASQSEVDSAIVRSQAEGTLRTMQVLDQALLVLRDDYLRLGRDLNVQQRLDQVQIGTGLVGNVGMIGPDGRIVVANNKDMRANYSDRDYFQHLRNETDDHLHISKPLIGKASGFWIVTLSRRISAPDGSFAGVAFMAVKPEYLLADLQGTLLASRATLAVIGLDGTTRIRNSGGLVSYGDDVKSSKLFQEIAKDDLGQFPTVSVTDGIRRIVSYRVLRKYGLVVVFASALDDVLQQVQTRTLTSIWFGVLSTALLSLVWGIAYAYLRRIREEGQSARNNAEKLRNIVDCSPVPMAINDDALNITFLNRAFIAQYGYDTSDIPTVADWWPKAYPDPQYRESVMSRWVAELQRVERTGEDFRPLEINIRCKDGSSRDVIAIATKIAKNFKEEHLVALYDITQQIKAQTDLKRLVQEKNSLLREVHHRVKNNLQVITSLLRLESNRTPLVDSKRILGEMQGRVRTMALLHENLYRSGADAAVDLSTYLAQLSTEIVRAMTTGKTQIGLQSQLEPVWVNLDQANPCGLLVNELLSNAMKHGFHGRSQGSITLRLAAADATGQVTLEVSDDGNGLPADWQTRSEGSLGLQLVGDLVQQLRGSLEVGPPPLAHFTIHFTPAATRVQPSGLGDL